jgi:DNA-binding Lrp family transcriptional regulator
MTTAEKILEYISKNGQASGKALSDYLNDITSRAVRKQLKNLLDKGKLRKIGRPPKVYYSLEVNKEKGDIAQVDKQTQRIIDDKYLYISPTGEAIPGWKGFVAWSNKKNQDPIKTAKEYIATIKKFNQFRKNNLIDGMPKMKNTFKEVFLDKLFYLDFYSIERFGKTKLGQMLLYAKQSQSTPLIHQLINEIRPQILEIITKYKIDGILFIPPTVKREVQFMRELERMLRLPVSTLSVTKVKTDIIVPQKTLAKLEDRIENAKRTIIVDDMKQYKNIFLIDDAVGSGATLNETAKQIKNKELLSGNIIGLAITGSFKGFDIISEV